MAEAVNLALEKLDKALNEEATLLFRVRDQFASLKIELIRMKMFLKDAPSSFVKNWVREIRDVAYETEDLIDTYLLKTNRPIGFTKRYAFFFNKLISQYKFGKEIEGIRLKIHEIHEIAQGTSTYRRIYEPQRHVDSRQTSPLLSEEVVVCLEKDTEKLVAELLDEHPERRFISIVGMGGLGKTTLAKKIYNSSDVRRHFECRAWVCVSQNREIDEKLRDIAKGVTGNITNLNNMNKRDLEEKLHALMNEKKYLVVLDDVWTTRDCDDIKPSLPDGMNGSRVLLTTRSENVARYADPMTSPLHMLPLLSEDESWELLCKKVFPTENDVTNCPLELEVVGKKIAERCGGLRLAIVAMGGLLSTMDRSDREWRKVCERLTQGQGHENCLEILALSYNDLPPNLKLCFLYFGLFPKNYAIPKKELIHLWVTEGFIQIRGEETLQESAEDILEELIQRSMIQAVRRSSGSVKTCHIHVLMRDLAIKEGKEAGFLHIHDDAHFGYTAHRLAIHGSIKEYISLNNSTPHIRTLLCFPGNEHEFLDKGEWIHILKGLKLLRVLNFPIACGSEVINNLITLRCLKLRDQSLSKDNTSSTDEFFFLSSTDRRPLNISMLHNLQTLDIHFCGGFYICNSIWKMKQLRHLYLSGMPPIEPPQKADDISLVNLHTLKTIGGDSWRLAYLVKLVSLRKLRIEGKTRAVDEGTVVDSAVTLESMRTLSWDIREADLDLSHLPTMLSWCPHLRTLKIRGTLQKLPNNLDQFMQQLVKVSLSHTQLNEDPMAKLQKLPKLQILYLDDSYIGREMDCLAGGFPQLERLILVSEISLTQWRVEEGTMPSLRYLKIDGCMVLQMLPDGLRGLTKLIQLFIHMPMLFNARLRQDEGADWDKIKHIPSITIENWR